MNLKLFLSITFAVAFFSLSNAQSYLWEKTIIKSTNDSWDEGLMNIDGGCIAYAKNGDWVSGGRIYNCGGSYLISNSLHGEQKFLETLFDTYSISSIIQAKDGNLVMIGELGYVSDVGDMFKSFVSEIDTNYAPMWSNQFSDSVVSQGPFFTFDKIIQLDDSSFIVSQSSYQTPNHHIFFHLGAKGNLLGIHNFNDSVYDICAIPHDSFLVSTHHGLLVSDTSGNFRTIKTYKNNPYYQIRMRPNVFSGISGSTFYDFNYSGVTDSVDIGAGNNINLFEVNDTSVYLAITNKSSLQGILISLSNSLKQKWIYYMPAGVNIQAISLNDTLLGVSGFQNYNNNWTYAGPVTQGFVKIFDIKGNYSNTQTDAGVVNIKPISFLKGTGPSGTGVMVTANITVKNFGTTKIDSVWVLTADYNDPFNVYCNNVDIGRFNNLHLQPGDTVVLPVRCFYDYVGKNFQVCVRTLCPNNLLDANVLNDNFCSNVTVGIESNPGAIPLFNLYPNPAENCLIVSNLDNSDRFTFCIYSSAGQIIYQKTLSNQREQLDISSLHAGLYLYQIKTSSGIVSGKFEKE